MTVEGCLHVVRKLTLVGSVLGVLGQGLIPLEVASTVVLAVDVVVVDGSVLVATGGSHSLRSRLRSRLLGGRLRLGLGSLSLGLDNRLRPGSRGRRRGRRRLGGGAGLGLLNSGVGRRRGRRRGSDRRGGNGLRSRSRGRLRGRDEVRRVGRDGHGDDVNNPFGGSDCGADRGSGGKKSKRGLHFVKVDIENAKPVATSVSLQVARETGGVREVYNEKE